MSRHASIERAGLVLAATGVLSLVSVRGYLEDSAPAARDLTLAFGAFLALALVASARTPPRWARAFALLATTAAYLWGTTLVGGVDVGVLLVIAAAALAYMLAEPAYRALVVGGFALWTPALQLFAGHRVIAAELVAAAVIALALLAFAVRRARAVSEERLRQIGLALLAIAIVSAVFERHDVVASRILAPDDVMALLAPVALAALVVAPLPGRIRDALATGIALAAYALVGMALILGKGYHVDAVAAPHHAASLLLAGHNPYVDFDMRDALARFDLPQTLATKLEDGSYLHSLNYPAAAILVVVPFVALGAEDIRWVYLGEMLLFGLLLIGRARIPWRPLVAGLIVGNTVLTRQYVLAGIDPTWAIGVAVSWLFFERPVLSPVALGIACAARQPAWLFAPFYLLASWRASGAREAMRRAALVGVAFAVPNLPFALAAPEAYLSSVLTPLAGPLEPYGVGIVRLGVLGPLPLFPRLAYAVAAFAVLVLLAWTFWRRWRELPIAPLTFPLVPLYFAWRSLQNYFVFVPLLTILRDQDLVEGPPAVRLRAASSATRPRASLSRETRPEEAVMPVDKELLEILACPVDKEPVREEGDRLVCTKCGRRYPVRDGIPVMLVEEAEPPGP